MKPLKSALGLSIWILRIALVVLISVTFLAEFTAFEYKSKEFYLATAFLVFAFFMLIGGFVSKPTLTVISGFILSILSLYSLIVQFSNGIVASLATFLILFAVSFFFVCNGNKA